MKIACKQVVALAIALGLWVVGEAEAKSPSPYNEVKGTIESISTTAVVVAGTEYSFTSSTEFEKNDQHVSVDAFAVGDFVEVKYTDDKLVIEIESEAPKSTDDSGSTVGNNSGRSSRTIRFRRFLSPLNGSLARAKVEAKYKRNENEFKVSLKLPRNTVPAVATNTEAAALDINAVVTREGETVATCDLRFNRKRREPRLYEYHVEIDAKSKKRGTRVKAKKGTCRLSDDKVGIPVIKKGDQVVVTEESVGEFLSGTI